MKRLELHLNPVFESLLRQIQIGEDNRPGIKFESAEKFLSKNGEYAVKDFIDTVNDQFRGRYLFVNNGDRIVCLAFIPKDMKYDLPNQLNERRLAILCLIFIYNCNMGDSVPLALLQEKLGEFIGLTSINSELANLKRNGFIAEEGSSKDKSYTLTEICLHILPNEVLEAVLKRLGKDPLYFEKLKRILPPDYLSIKRNIQQKIAFNEETSGVESFNDNNASPNDNPNPNEES